MERERKFNMSNLSPEDADRLGDQIGERLRQIIDRTVQEANAFLKIYGIQAKMQIALEPIEPESKGE